MGAEEIRALKERAKLPKVKKIYRLPKKSKKRLEQEAANPVRKDENGDTALQRWYKDRQKQLVGRCMRCGEKYNHHNLTYAIAATAHVLPKRKEMFLSVATHPDNYIELGAGCGCHNWYDLQASWEEIALSPIWPLVLEKFLLFQKDITEREKIPDVFLQEIKPKI